MWRLPIALRVLAAVGSAVLPLVMLYGLTQAPDQIFGWVALVAITAAVALNASAARRSCEVDGRQLRAKGRFASRTVELSDLRQAAIGLAGVWVQTHHPLDGRGGTVLYLRMIPTSKMSWRGRPVEWDAVELILDRAAAAGAELDAPLIHPQQPYSRKPLIFSI